ncbi:hypothetical protein GCM10029964_050520 [Kibdelosporangium lantanae]
MTWISQVVSSALAAGVKPASVTSEGDDGEGPSMVHGFLSPDVARVGDAGRFYSTGSVQYGLEVECVTQSGDIRACVN